MTLNKFIDFKKLFENEISSMITNVKDSVYPLQNKNIKSYVDDEIKNVPPNILDIYNNLLLDAADEKYVKIKDKFLAPIIVDIDGEGCRIDYAKFYKSANHYVVYFDVIADEDELIFLGAINKSSKEYLFLGTFGEHPFIATNDFVYDNSDGSGSNISEFIGGSFSVYTILVAMMRFYTEFINNQYH